MLSADSVKLLVSSFLLRDVDTDGKAEVFTLRDLMNVFENLNNLRENYDSLNNLFEDLRNFNDLFNSGVDWNVSLFNSIGDLNFSLNPIDDAFSVDELADFSNFFSDSFNGLLIDSGGCNLNDLSRMTGTSMKTCSTVSTGTIFSTILSTISLTLKS